jgi:hypothetical protein
MIEPSEATPPSLVLVKNWFEELKRLVSVKSSGAGPTVNRSDALTTRRAGLTPPTAPIIAAYTSIATAAQ